MSAEELQLGRLSLHHRVAQLSVSSRSTVRFSKSTALQILQSTLLTTTVQSALEQFWIGRGQGLKLKFHIAVDGHPLPVSEIHELGSTIYNSQLWDRLNLPLDVAFQNPSQGEDYCMEGILALRIAHHRTALATPNHSASKICYGLTLGDLKPPEGIEMLHLEEVCIYLQISSLPPIPDLDCYSCPGTFSSDIVPASPFEDLLRSELLETSSACLYQSPMLICSNQDIVPYSGENGSKVSNTTRIFREDSKMLEEDVDGFMLLERGSSGTAPNLEGHGLESDVDQYAEDVTEKGYSLNALVSLLETALELTIHDRAKIPLDIVVIENSIRLPLSEIVPTLWRTGYLSTLSLQAPLIPTISHALSGTLHKNAHSTTLKEKLKLLWKNLESKPDLEAPETISPNAKLSRVSVTSVSVWRLLVRESLNSKSSRDIKSMSRTRYSKRQMSDHDMVFDVQEPGHELHPLEEGDLLLPILERCDGRDSLLFQSLSPSMVSSESWKSDLEGESDCE